MKQVQAYIDGEWRDVSYIDYASGLVVVWEFIEDAYNIEDVKLRIKEESE